MATLMVVHMDLLGKAYPKILPSKRHGELDHSEEAGLRRLGALRQKGVLAVEFRGSELGLWGLGFRLPGGFGSKF